MYFQRAMDRQLAISSLLSEDTTRMNLRSREREELLAELVEPIPGLKRRPGAKEAILQAVREREQMHSTAIGEGVAIPHARNAIEGVTTQPVVVFGRHTEGLPFGASDGQPVRLFFLLIAPTITQHLQILARLSRVLRDGVLRARLLNASTPAEAIDCIRQTEESMGLLR